MSEHNEIKNYESIRALIRKLFLYGDVSVDELADTGKFKGLSTIYDNITRIGNFINDPDRIKTNSFEQEGIHKQTKSIVYDPLIYPINDLAKTFQESTFKVNDICFYFTLMQMFYESGNENRIGTGEWRIFKKYYRNTDDSFVFSSNDDGTEQGLKSDFFKLLAEKNKFLYRLGLQAYKSRKFTNPFSDLSLYRYFTELKDNLGIFIDMKPVLEKHEEEKKKKKNKDNIPIYETKNSSNDFFYKLSNDIFSELMKLPNSIFAKVQERSKDISYDTPMEPSILDCLLYMVNFFYNHSDIAVPGWQLSNTLTSYMYTIGAGDFNAQEEPIFVSSDSNILSVIDNDILWEIITCIHKHMPISFHYSNGKENPVSGKTKNDCNNNGPIYYPIKVICERQYGRQYLFAYNYEKQTYSMYRLDRISNVEPVKRHNDKFSFLQLPAKPSLKEIEAELEMAYRKVFENVWNIDIGAYKEPQIILIHFKADKDLVPKLIYAVTSRNPKGILTETDKGFDYKITTVGTNDIKPWIRQFSPYATVDKESNLDLFEEIKDSLTEMLKRYDTV